MSATLRKCWGMLRRHLGDSNMHKEQQLVPHTILFGKVIAYKCTACDKVFSISLFGGAVSEDFPPPAGIGKAFFRHTCGENTSSLLYAAHHKCLEYFMDDDDIPASYLLYIVAVFVAIGLIVVGVFFYLFR